jgi:hypothetical protein
MPEHDEPDDRLEADLRRLAAAAVAASEGTTAADPANASAGLTATVTPLRHRSHQRWLGVAAALLAVVILGAGALSLSRNGSDLDTDPKLYTTPGSSTSVGTGLAPVATDAPRAPLPPFEEPGPVVPWLSTRSVPTSGGDVVVILHNSGTEQFSYGVGSQIDRWDGASWTIARKIELCLDFWHCAGTLRPADQPLMVRMIGLSVGPGKWGDPLFARIEGLEPGWYRFGKGGEFEVTDHPEPSAPIGDVHAYRLSVKPAVLPESGGTLRITNNPPNDGGIQDPVQQEAQLFPGATLQRWTGSTWTLVPSTSALELRSPAPDEVNGNIWEKRADVGPLAPGSYRILRHLLDGTEVMGVFWVVEPTP